MGTSKASRTARERLKNQYSGHQFVGNDVEVKETDRPIDHMCVDGIILFADLFETFLAARQDAHDALPVVQDSVNSMQTMHGL